MTWYKIWYGSIAFLYDLLICGVIFLLTPVMINPILKKRWDPEVPSSRTWLKKKLLVSRNFCYRHSYSKKSLRELFLMWKIMDLYDARECALTELCLRRECEKRRVDFSTYVEWIEISDRKDETPSNSAMQRDIRVHRASENLSI